MFAFMLHRPVKSKTETWDEYRNRKSIVKKMPAPINAEDREKIEFLNRHKGEKPWLDGRRKSYT